MATLTWLAVYAATGGIDFIIQAWLLSRRRRHDAATGDPIRPAWTNEADTPPDVTRCASQSRSADAPSRPRFDRTTTSTGVEGDRGGRWSEQVPSIAMARSIWSGTISFGHTAIFPHQNR